jgi:hypothetical protein
MQRRGDIARACDREKPYSEGLELREGKKENKINAPRSDTAAPFVAKYGVKWPLVAHSILVARIREVDWGAEEGHGKSEESRCHA